MLGTGIYLPDVGIRDSRYLGAGSVRVELSAPLMALAFLFEDGMDRNLQPYSGGGDLFYGYGQQVLVSYLRCRVC